MRRLLWCAPAVVLAGGIGLYAVAVYAVWHPHSPIGQNTAAVVGFIARISPLRLPQPEVPFEGATEAIADAASSLPPALPKATPPDDPSQDAQMMDFIHSIPTMVHLDGDPNHPPKELSDRRKDAVGEGSEEEEFDAPRFMPPCTDDEDAPATMPYAHRYADEEPQPVGFIDVRTPKDLSAAKADEGASEESEIPFDRNPANCQKDPNFQYQYPGCPYTGAAPAGRSASHGSAPETATDPHSDKKSSPPNVDSRLKSKLPPAGSGEEQEDATPHTDVDTMEFRPTDARNGEFKKRIQ